MYLNNSAKKLVAAVVHQMFYTGKNNNLFSLEVVLPKGDTTVSSGVMTSTMVLWYLRCIWIILYPH